MSPGEATTQQGYVSEEALEVLEEAPKVLEGAPRVLEEDPRVLEEAPRVLEEAPSVLEGAPRVLEEGSLTLIHIRGQVAGKIFQVFTSAFVATIPSNSFQSSIFDRLFVSNPVLSFPEDCLSSHQDHQ